MNKQNYLNFTIIKLQFNFSPTIIKVKMNFGRDDMQQEKSPYFPIP